MTNHNSLLSQGEAGIAWITLKRTARRNAAEPHLIITIHGAGYLFTASVAA